MKLRRVLEELLLMDLNILLPFTKLLIILYKLDWLILNKSLSHKFLYHRYFLNYWVYLHAHNISNLNYE